MTTHDLALAEIADGSAPQAANVHFEDHFEDGKMRFDYPMRPGSSRTAMLALMRAVGLELMRGPAMGFRGIRSLISHLRSRPGSIERPAADLRKKERRISRRMMSLAPGLELSLLPSSRSPLCLSKRTEEMSGRLLKKSFHPLFSRVAKSV